MSERRSAGGATSADVDDGGGRTGAEDPKLERSVSSASTNSGWRFRINSNASSSGGSRASCYSEAGGHTFPTVPETEGSIPVAGHYGEGQVVDAVQQTGDHSVSEPVPHGISSLRVEDDLKFLLDATFCDPYKIAIKNMQAILSGDHEVNDTPFVGDHLKYKLCLYVRSHKGYLAIGLRILKSDGDKNLVWPFKSIVVFRLINQSGETEDIIKMFRSEKNASQLKDGLSKPKKVMNLPIGYPCFISRERLQGDGFIRDNKMVVACYIFPKDTKINCRSEYPSIIR